MNEQIIVGAAEPDAASGPFVRRWNTLVSTTNWEKGRIIHEWRASLIEAGATVQKYSDEAWSRRVGHVSPQHVGRLRRVFERFGDECDQYEGLYWSHFQAATDWPDAEMWLEGAVQNGWSVANMRHARWEAYGASEEQRPREEDVIVAELDEDAGPGGDRFSPASAGEQAEVAQGPDLSQGADFGDGDLDNWPEDAQPPESIDGVLRVDETSNRAVRPFEDLPELPPDLSEAFEVFKLAILRHKMNEWRDVAQDDVLAALEGLQRLVTAPA